MTGSELAVGPGALILLHMASHPPADYPLVCSHGGFRVPRRANEDIPNASSSCIMFDNVPLDPVVSCYCSVAQSCPTLSDPMDCSLPGSSVHGVLPARILEWVAISYSKVSSWTRDRTCVSCIGRRLLYH